MCDCQKLCNSDKDCYQLLINIDDIYPVRFKTKKKFKTYNKIWILHTSTEVDPDYIEHGF